MSKELNEEQNAIVGMTVGVIEVRSTMHKNDLLLFSPGRYLIHIV